MTEITVQKTHDPESLLPVYFRSGDNSSAYDVTFEAREYIKTVPTRMVRMDGPFMVQTRESPRKHPFVCQDGYLAMDARGYPYAIAADEQEKVYRQVGEDEAVATPPPVDLEYLRRWAIEQAIEFASGEKELLSLAKKIEDYVINGGQETSS